MRAYSLSGDKGTCTRYCKCSKIGPKTDKEKQFTSCGLTTVVEATSVNVSVSKYCVYCSSIIRLSNLFPVRDRVYPIQKSIALQHPIQTKR